MIIDGHLHLMEQIVPFNCNGWGRMTGDGCIVYDTGQVVRILPEGMGDRSFTMEAALKLMDENGIAKAILMQSGGYGLQNSYAMLAAKTYPDRFCATASLDPYCLKSAEILDNLTDNLGFSVLKFEMSEVGGFCGYNRAFEIDSKEMAAVFARAQSKNMTLVFDLGGSKQASYQLDSFKKAISKYCDVKFVFCHLLCPDASDMNSWKRDITGIRAENVWFDFSSLPHFLKDSVPFARSSEYLECAAELVGVDRLIWGSDAPSSLLSVKYADYLKYFMNDNTFSSSELEAMSSYNAAFVYGMSL